MAHVGPCKGDKGVIGGLKGTYRSQGRHPSATAIAASKYVTVLL